MAKDAFPCPCCGHRVFGEQPGSYAVCPVCFWEDDVVQLRWSDCSGGANRPSLMQAQRNYQRFGAMEERFISHVRGATEGEPVDDQWRPIDPAKDRFEPSGEKSAAWPDYATLYWWREDFWLRHPS